MILKSGRAIAVVVVCFAVLQSARVSAYPPQDKGVTLEIQKDVAGANITEVMSSVTELKSYIDFLLSKIEILDKEKRAFELGTRSKLCAEGTSCNTSDENDDLSESDLSKSRSTKQLIELIRKQLRDLNLRVREVEMSAIACKRNETDTQSRQDAMIQHLMETMASLKVTLIEMHQSFLQKIEDISDVYIPKSSIPTIDEIFLHGKSFIIDEIDRTSMEKELVLQDEINRSIDDITGRMQIKMKEGSRETVALLGKRLGDMGKEWLETYPARFDYLNRRASERLSIETKALTEDMKHFAKIQTERKFNEFLRSRGLGDFVSNTVNYKFQNSDYNAFTVLKKQIDEFIGEVHDQMITNQEEISSTVYRLAMSLSRVILKYGDTTKLISQDDLFKLVESFIRDRITFNYERPVVINQASPRNLNTLPDLDAPNGHTEDFETCFGSGHKCFLFHVSQPKAKTIWHTIRRFRALVLSYDPTITEGCSKSMAPTKFTVTLYWREKAFSLPTREYTTELGQQIFLYDHSELADRIEVEFHGNQGHPNYVCLHDIQFKGVKP